MANGRYHHVYRLAVRPTWSTRIMHKTLKWRSIDFQIQLMDDSWTTPAQSQVYLLGQTVNFQVTALHLPHGSLKLFIRNCYATTTSGTSATYTIIDNFGCMQESQRNLGRARFVSPRTDGSLRFSLSAFQFTSDPHVQVTMHCNVFLTSEEPGPLHKSCSYTEHGWRALTGEHTICDCCNTTCSRLRSALLEGSVTSSPLQISDQSYLTLTPAEQSYLTLTPAEQSFTPGDTPPAERRGLKSGGPELGQQKDHEERGSDLSDVFVLEEEERGVSQSIKERDQR
ncbi:zona pellucida sperm-binding protein 3 isoform X4 [Osmerus eperlanus]|uniref:zona pellucida sperm-binding protein 3 isoform X4 n=1 Tax=Osmerus eperlanus TaxID=29151 RepID=UPI002E0EC1EA